MALFRKLAAALRGATFWLARRAGRERLGVDALAARYEPGFRSLRRLLPEVLSPTDHAALSGQVAELTAAGAPEAEAMAVAVLQPLTIAADLVDLATASSWPAPNVARLYHAAGEAFGFDRLRAAAGGFAAGDPFERVALRRLLEDLLAEQAQLTRAIMGFSAGPQAGVDPGHAQAAVSAWAERQDERAHNAARAIADIEAAGGPWSFAKLTIANAALRELAAEGAKGRRKRS
jgi:glutamate dehydrogenase